MYISRKQIQKKVTKLLNKKISTKYDLKKYLSVVLHQASTTMERNWSLFFVLVCFIVT